MMEWQNEKLKKILKQNKMNQVKLSELTGVTRQTVRTWINGQMPKGSHLISLCNVFHVSPDYFFSPADQSPISVPAHRTRRKAKVTPELQKDAISLAQEYANFFRNDDNPVIMPVGRFHGRDDSAVKIIADVFRKMSGVTEKDKPLNYEGTFRLLAGLGIKVVFRNFPQHLKTYAFFTKIY